MIKHRCGYQVLVMFKYTVQTGLIISREGITPVGQAKLTIPDKKNLFCPRCNTNINNIKEIIGTCMECGKDFSASDLYLLNNIGGIYCASCAEEMFPGNRKFKLSTILENNISFE